MAHKITSQDSMRASFARNLRRLMYSSGITQKDLTEKLQVTSSTVSAWCSGQKMPRAEKIDMLSNIFDVDRSELLGEETGSERKTKGDYIYIKSEVFDEPIYLNDILLAMQISKLDSYRKNLIQSIINSDPEQTKEG